MMWGLLENGQPDLAIEMGEKTVELEPDFAPVHRTLGYAYWVKGRRDEAITSLEAAAELGGPMEWMQLAYSYARLDRKSEALELLERLRSAKAAPSLIGTVYGGLGEMDEALEWFDRAFEADEYDPFLILSKTWLFRLDPLRDDPRFQDLLP
jgi:tetratricopeptide (TPR) repeat protein